MLSLIEFLETERGNRIKYLFYLRGIITCTDNIIDEEIAIIYLIVMEV